MMRTRWALYFVLAAIPVAATTVACTAVVGDGDYKVAPSTGNSTGDSCSLPSACTSGLCSTGGWCTDSCSSTNAVCAGGHGSDGLENEFGQLNWCILNSANVDSCFPGCTSAADCAPYPGTSCQSSTDATGVSVQICSK